eukprot:jgi/Ulvmu1/11235/UM073_0007.1
MASAGAIVTVQLGSYANHVGSHFWNFQDEALGLLTDAGLGVAAQEILAGKLFTNSQTLTPRLVIVDTAGCCGGVGLQDPVPQLPKQLLWQPGVEVIELEKVKPSKFYQLLLDEDDAEKHSEDEAIDEPAHNVDEQMQDAEDDEDGPSELEAAAAELDTPEGPRFFTDFFKCILHPQSVVEVPLLGALEPPSGFGDITNDEQTRRQVLEDVDERIRKFAEEASALEGFQILCDPWSPWSGISAACAAALSDDYPNQTRVLFGARAPLSPNDALMHELAATGTLSGALSTAHWMTDCSIVVPVDTSAPATRPPQPQHAAFDQTRPFHASAAAAAAVECCTLPWRVAPLPGAGGAGPPSVGTATMASWAAGLTTRGANIVATGGVLPAVSVPFAAAVQEDERLSAREKRLRRMPVETQPVVPPALVNERLQWALQPGVGKQFDPLEKVLAESVVWRGCRHGGQAIPAAAGLQHLKDGLEAEGLRAVRQLSAVAMPLPIPISFPRVFGEGLDAAGDLEAPGEAAAGRSSGGAGRGSSQCGRGPTQRQHVRSCAVLSRTVASGVFEGLLKQQADVIKGATRSAAGKACLTRWDLQGEDVAEYREHLLSSAGLYQDMDRPSSSDDEGDF